MQELIWWQHAVIYEIYARSFQDSNGDGIGDLNGIIKRIDYLVLLGVDAIWISPIYPSPMADFGYDVSDYCGIDPIFGTMQDFDRLVAESHRRGLKVILDFVPNHTPINIRGFWKVDRHVKIQSEIGLCGEMNRTIGPVISAALAGNGMKQVNSITTTPS